MIFSYGDGETAQIAWEDGESEVHDPFVDLFFFLMAVVLVLWAIWSVVFIDNRYGNREVPEDHIVIDGESKLKPVLPTEKVVKRDYIAGLIEEIEEANERAQDAEDHAAALGVPKMGGGAERVVFLVDLQSCHARQEMYERVITKEPADKLLVIGFGDKVEAISSRMSEADAAYRESVCKWLDGQSTSNHLRLIDAVEAALALEGGTRINLCLSGLPEGKEELLSYLRRRESNLVPINGIDLSFQNAEVGQYLNELADLSGGSYAEVR